MTKIIFAGGVELSITSICSMNNFTKQKTLKSLLFLGILVGAFFEVQAQEVLTKVDGGVSWVTGSGGIYSGDGETPSDVDVTVTDNIDFDGGTLFIDGTNNKVGVGTSSPLFDFDVSDNLASLGVRSFIDNGADPLVILDKSRGTISSPTSVQSSDDLGRISFRGHTGGGVYNESVRIGALVDGTPSGTRVPAKITFHTATTGGLSERMVIESGGDVGIGVTNPGHLFEVGTSDAAKPGGGSWVNSSDIRLKNIDGQYTRGLSDIIQLNPVSYHYKNVEDKTWNEDVLAEQYHGFIAQELREVYPECVKEDEDGYLTVNVSALNVSYVNAIKELHQLNSELKTENQQIKAELDWIKKALNENGISLK
jgi:hypothetical protein